MVVLLCGVHTGLGASAYARWQRLASICTSRMEFVTWRSCRRFQDKQLYCFSFVTMMQAGLDSSGGARWDRFANTRIRRVELSTNPAELPAHWNTCTGNWLRQYVYERLTPKGRKPSFKTLLATQLVAGVWHGLFPGYALFFASSAFLFESGKVGPATLAVNV